MEELKELNQWEEPIRGSRVEAVEGTFPGLPSCHLSPVSSFVVGAPR